VNQTDKIPAYVQTVQTNLQNAIPTIVKSIQNEINYDKNLFSSIGTATVKAPVAKALEAAPAATKTDAGTTKTPATGADAQDSDATGTHETKTGTKTGKGEASAENTGNQTKPTDPTPAKDAPAKDAPGDSTPAKDGKPGKTDGVHHQGVTGTTGTTGTTHDENTGGAATPAKSGPSKTDGTHNENAGAGKHTAGTAGHTGHSAK